MTGWRSGVSCQKTKMEQQRMVVLHREFTGLDGVMEMQRRREVEELERELEVCG